MKIIGTNNKWREQTQTWPEIKIKIEEKKQTPRLGHWIKTKLSKQNQAIFERDIRKHHFPTVFVTSSVFTKSTAHRIGEKGREKVFNLNLDLRLINLVMIGPDITMTNWNLFDVFICCHCAIMIKRVRQSRKKNYNNNLFFLLIISIGLRYIMFSNFSYYEVLSGGYWNISKSSIYIFKKWNV